MSRVVFRVDKVTVVGVTIDDKRAFEAALLAELSNAFEQIDGKDLPRGNVTAQSRRGQARLPSPTDSKEAGRRVAHGIAGALRR